MNFPIFAGEIYLNVRTNFFPEHHQSDLRVSVIVNTSKKEMMLSLQNLTYRHPNGDLLFSGVNLNINRQGKIALIGNNGSGKSTLLGILAGNLYPSNGTVTVSSKPYFVQQVFGQFNDETVAGALRIDDKITAVNEILDGRVTDENLAVLDDDWTIEERCREAFAYWQLDGLNLTQKMTDLSGGEKTRVFLAGILIHQPDIILLDEPSNHLDGSGRNMLYDYIASTNHTLVVVSHDRTLLNLFDTIGELGSQGIQIYGGNYDFYAEQKMIERKAFDEGLKAREKSLRKARETERASLEKQQKLDSRGKKKQEKAGLPTISMNTFRNNAEKSTARMKNVHADKVDIISRAVRELRSELPRTDKMKMDLDDMSLHKGKILVTAKEINFGYDGGLLWKQGLNFQITSGDRIVIKGPNGSGKTSLLRMILGELLPGFGILDSVSVKAIYVDQDYSLIDSELSVYEQAQQYNARALQEHEIKTRLNRFLFTKADWDKPCRMLSGGERMRLMLCSLAIGIQAPEMMILDEPTNNLDIQNIDILTGAITGYSGTLLVVSHDEYFLEQINLDRSIFVG